MQAMPARKKIALREDIADEITEKNWNKEEPNFAKKNIKLQNKWSSFLSKKILFFS